MLFPSILSSIIFSTAKDTSSINTGWNLILPFPKRGIKKDNLNIGSNRWRNTSPPPIITPGRIIIEFLILLKASFSDLNTALLREELLSLLTPSPEKKIYCSSNVFEFKILIN